MLFVLTGEIQSGKTRWLESLLAELAERGVRASGVIAPGRWRTVEPDEGGGPTGGDGPAGAGAPRFEKLGIDNVLLPGGRTVDFATRRDLLERDAYDRGCTQARQLQLGWAIGDDAVAQVNAHLRGLPDGVAAGRGLLVVDELGRLEVERGTGLTGALELLGAGPSPAWQHALVVVRDYLLDRVVGRFAGAWGGHSVLRPGDEARETLLRAF